MKYNYFCIFTKLAILNILYQSRFVNICRFVLVKHLTLRLNFTESTRPRSVPLKAFCTCYKNVGTYGCNAHTQIPQLQYRVPALYDNIADKLGYFSKC